MAPLGRGLQGGTPPAEAELLQVPSGLGAKALDRVSPEGPSSLSFSGSHLPMPLTERSRVLWQFHV